MKTEAQVKILRHYEEVREISLSMVHAARQSDWDALVEGEQRCAAAIGCLQVTGDDTSLLDEPAKKRAHEIICAILANDAEIRDLAQPWLRQLESHLCVSRATRRVAAAYSA